MNVSIVGAGHVGLVTGAGLAEKGHLVACVDVDPARIDAINRFVPPFHEPGLDELLHRHIGRRLRATTDLEGSVAATDLTYVAVPTPDEGEGGAIDLRFVRAAAEAIGRAIAAKERGRRHTVVVKSTVVPGTTDDIVRPILERASGRRAGDDLGVGMNPEFSSEGEAVQDFLVPDRIVLGGADARTLDLLDELHAGFAGVPKIRTNNRTAEMIKYASNAMLATAISFANEVANLCAALPDVDVVDVTRALHLTRYLTPILADGQRVRAPIASFFEAGCGFGGSCLPKDVKALVACGRALGERMDLLDAVRRVNQDRPGRLVQLLAEGLGGELAGRRVTVLGLAFKPGTDDVRESPAIPVVRDLVARGARVTAYDPAAGREAARALAAEAVRFAGTLEEAIAGAEGIVLVTRWEEFRSLPDLLAGREPAPLLVDGRRLVDRASYGRYIGIGIAHASAPRKTTPEISA